jgi:hypothetical protein
VVKFEDYHRTVVGYHGTNRSVALKVVAGDASILRSENDHDWLGNGVYYWEYAPKQAWEWANRQRVSGKWHKNEEIAVIASMIRLGFCFDLLDPDNVRELATYYDEYLMFCKTLGRPPKRNYQHKKYLDCAVFQFAYQAFDLDGTTVDSARAVYVPTKSEGRLWKSSWINKDSHIQLCVRNDDCILGSWLAKTL